MSRQVEDCQALAERLGWTVAEVVVDNDISASTRSKAKRPGFESLLRSVEAGDTDGILYYSTSRLTRRPVEYEAVIRLVETRGVRLATVASGAVDLSTADGRMIGRILAAQDAAEAERIGERVARAFQQRRAEGRANPVNRAYGFRTGGEDVEPREAEAIRIGAGLVLEGASLREVAARWTELGYAPITAAQWSATTVRRALTRPRVAGMVSQGDVVLGRGTGEAILDEETWKAVVERLSERAGRYQRGAYTGSAHHLLAGFMTCGRCGHRVKVNGLRDAEGGLRPESYVICPVPEGGCGLKRNLGHLERFVTYAVEARLRMIGDRRPDEAVRSEQTSASLEVERERIRASISRTRELYAGGTIEPEDFVATLRLLNGRLEAASAALAELPAGPVEGDLLAAWLEGDLSTRRRILAEVVELIALLPMGRIGPTRSVEAIPETTVISWR